MKIKSTKVQSDIIKWLNKLERCKAIPITISPYIEVGTPDILAAFKGTGIFIEVKNPGEEPTDIQYRRLDEWAEAGFECIWVTTLTEVKEFIEEKL